MTADDQLHTDPQLTVHKLFVSGGPDPEIALAYVQDLFMKRKPENKKVYLHVTCATDTDLMRTVLKDVFEILVDINLKKLATL